MNIKKRLSILVFFIGLMSMTPLALAENNTQCQKDNCIIIVDAGSTGTRLHLFHYEKGQITEIDNNKVTPGLGTLEPETNTLYPYLNQLFATTQAQELPVYFYATGGMRLLSSTKQDQYYKIISQWFGEHPQWQLSEAKTITGREEGLYDWLSVNYQLGSLTSADKPMVGVMDMGGASVQIAFPVSDHLNHPDVQTVSIGGRKVSLFVHSYLGLGQTLLAQQFLNEPACFPMNYVLPDGDRGNGDAITCSQSIATLINTVHGVNQQIASLVAGHPVDQWYVLGGVVNMVYNQPYQFAPSQFNNQQMLQQAEESICKQPWENLRMNYPTDDYLYEDCLLAAYYHALMIDGYGLQEDTPLHHLSTKADWTIGAVYLNLSSKVH